MVNSKAVRAIGMFEINRLNNLAIKLSSFHLNDKTFDLPSSFFLSGTSRSSSMFTSKKIKKQTCWLYSIPPIKTYKFKKLQLENLHALAFSLSRLANILARHG